MVEGGDEAVGDGVIEGEEAVMEEEVVERGEEVVERGDEEAGGSVGEGGGVGAAWTGGASVYSICKKAK